MEHRTTGSYVFRFMRVVRYLDIVSMLLNDPRCGDGDGFIFSSFVYVVES